MRSTKAVRCVKRSTPKPDPLIVWAQAVVKCPAEFYATDRDCEIVAELLAEATR